MKVLLLGLLIFVASCGSNPPPPECNESVKSQMQHTGVVTVTEISIGYCEIEGKIGTSLCDRTITYHNDKGQFYNLQLYRSGQQVPEAR